MNASLPIIEVNGLSKRYKLGHFNMTSFREEIGNLFTKRRDQRPSRPTANEDFWALRDVSFSVNRGEVVGVIGRNGAGKSTLLKILSRITEPTAGEAVLRGRVASLLEVGTGFHPELSGRENIFLNGAILGMKRVEIAAKFDEIVDFAEVGQFIDTPVKRYSSGMYVRLAFAVAAHLEPDILIVDEVLAVGDAAFQKKCVAKMNEVSGHGRTVLFVSHNLGLVQSLCSRAIYLKDGKVEYEGRTANAIQACRASQDLAPGQLQSHSRLLTGVEIVDHAGQSTDLVLTGKPLAIRIKARLGREHRRFIIRLLDSNSVLISSFDSGNRGARDNLGTPASVYSCQVDQLLVAPGRYTLDMEIWADGKHMESLTNVFQFEVAECELDGRIIRSIGATGIVPLTHRWQADLSQNSSHTP